MLIDVWKVLRKIRTLSWVGKINIALNVWWTRKCKIRLVAIMAVKNELPGFSAFVELCRWFHCVG